MTKEKLKSEYLPRIKSINRWLNENREAELRTNSFMFVRERGELYCIAEGIGPLIVDLESYTRLERLRQLIDEELQEQINHIPSRLTAAVSAMADEVDQLSHQYQQLNERLRGHKFRLQVTRQGAIRIVKMDETNPAETQTQEVTKPPEHAAEVHAGGDQSAI